jgi:hypothetical protein
MLPPWGRRAEQSQQVRSGPPQRLLLALYSTLSEPARKRTVARLPVGLAAAGGRNIRPARRLLRWRARWRARWIEEIG